MSEGAGFAFILPGIYVCSECGHELFSSTSKFEHSSPWPAFSMTIHEDSVIKEPEAWGPVKVRSQDGSHKFLQAAVYHLPVCLPWFLPRLVVADVPLAWATSSCTMGQQKDCHASESSAAPWGLSLKVSYMWWVLLSRKKLASSHPLTGHLCLCREGEWTKRGAMRGGFSTRSCGQWMKSSGSKIISEPRCRLATFTTVLPGLNRIQRNLGKSQLNVSTYNQFLHIVNGHLVVNKYETTLKVFWQTWRFATTKKTVIKKKKFFQTKDV